MLQLTELARLTPSLKTKKQSDHSLSSKKDESLSDSLLRIFFSNNTFSTGLLFGRILE